MAEEDLVGAEDLTLVVAAMLVAGVISRSLDIFRG